MAARKRKRQHDGAPGWAWMLLGLSIGLGVALYVYLSAGGPDFAPDTAVRTAVNQADRSSPAAPPQAVMPEPAPSQEPAAVDDADCTDCAFYTRLRDAEVVLPDDTAAATDRTELRLDVEIQAGAFRTFDDADERKATLAFHGIESRIRNVWIDGQRWHRIIIGPVDDQARVNEVIGLLRDQRIEHLPPRPVAD